MRYLQNFKFDIEGPSDAPKMVFLHGVMGAGANWRKVTPHFKQDFQVLTFDQRGHGWSFKPETGYAPEDYSSDLKKILDELNWQEIVLVGHSMGGRNALQFTHDHPAKVSALVIEDIGPEGNRQSMDRTAQIIEMVPVPFESKRAAKEYFETDFLEKVKHHPQAAMLGPYFYTNIEEKHDGTAGWRFQKDGILFSLRAGHFRPRWDQVRDLKCPTLFIRGERSEDLSRDEMDRVLALNPRIKGVEIAGAGHWVHYDKTLEFVQVLKDFLIEAKVL